MESKSKAIVVDLILDGRTEKALELLSAHYRVRTPKLRVGLPKGRKRNSLGCYNARNNTILILNSDTLKEPRVVLHEFYHHLRTTINLQHKGSEKNADDFARDFIRAYQSISRESFGK